MQKSSLFFGRGYGFKNQLPDTFPRQLQHASSHAAAKSLFNSSLEIVILQHQFFRSAGLHHGTSRVTSHLEKKTPVENSRPQAFCLRGFSDKLQTSTLNFAESWSLHRRLRREAEVKSVKLPARCGSLHTPGKKHRTTKKIQTQFKSLLYNISQCCTTLRCVSVPVPLSV